MTTRLPAAIKPTITAGIPLAQPKLIMIIVAAMANNNPAPNLNNLALEIIFWI